MKVHYIRFSTCVVYKDKLKNWECMKVYGPVNIPEYLDILWELKYNKNMKGEFHVAHSLFLHGIFLWKTGPYER